MLGRLFSFLAIIIFLFAFAFVIQTGYWEASTASQPQVEFNESVAIAEGELSGLSVSNDTDKVYAPQEDIKVEQNTTVIEQPGNWSWNRHNGTILILSGTSLNTSESAFVDGYYTVPSTSQNLTTTLGLLPSEVLGGSWQLMGVLLLVFMALGAAVMVGRSG